VKEGFVSINVDASFNLDTHTRATEAVIRDGKGDFVAASNNCMDYAFDEAATEALAIKNGM
jgi:hypothetical protein